MDNKIKKLNIIKLKLVNEYPFINLFIKKTVNTITIELYYNITKNTAKNKFSILDGGIKDRIIRKTKNLIKQQKLNYSLNSNNKYLFIVK